MGTFRVTPGIFGVGFASFMFERCYDFPLFYDSFFCHWKILVLLICQYTVLVW